MAEIEKDVHGRSQSVDRTLRSRHHQLARFKRILRKHSPELRERFEVKSLGIFGSYVHGEQRQRSDLDVLVEFDDDSLTLLKFIELEHYLGDLVGVKVDLVDKSRLKPRIGRRIFEEVVPV